MTTILPALPQRGDPQVPYEEGAWETLTRGTRAVATMAFSQIPALLLPSVATYGGAARTFSAYKNETTGVIETGKFAASAILFVGGFVDIAEGLYGLLTGARLLSNVDMQSWEAFLTLGTGALGIFLDLKFGLKGFRASKMGLGRYIFKETLKLWNPAVSLRRFKPRFKDSSPDFEGRDMSLNLHLAGVYLGYRSRRQASSGEVRAQLCLHADGSVEVISSAPRGLRAMGASGGLDWKKSLYARAERLLEIRAFPREMRKEDFGPFVDFLLQRMEALPAEHRDAFLKGLNASHLEAFFKEFRYGRPQPPLPAANPQPASHHTPHSSDEAWLRALLEPRQVEERLKARRGKSPAELLERTTSPIRTSLRHLSDQRLMSVGTNITPNSTMPLRYAGYWRWLATESPLKEQCNLEIFGVGVGVHPYVAPIRLARKHRREAWYQAVCQAGIRHGDPLPEAIQMQLVMSGKATYEHVLATTEVPEVVALFAREGRAHYIDLMPEPLTQVEEWLRTGRMLYPALEGPNSVSTFPSLFRSIVAHLGPEARVRSQGWNAGDAEKDIQWAIAALKAAGVEIRPIAPNKKLLGPEAELRFDRNTLQGVKVEQGDLLFHPLPQGSVDLAQALTTLDYIENGFGPLSAMALLRLAKLPKPQGLLAITDGIVGRQATEAHRTLLALGYQHLRNIPTTETVKRVDVYQRPERDSALFTELSALVGGLSS